MHVLWWLAPPVIATLLAMAWVGWAGRQRDEVRRDDSPEAMARLQRALAKPTPHKGRPVASVAVEPTHGVAVRRPAGRRTGVSTASGTGRPVPSPRRRSDSPPEDRLTG